LSSLTAAKRSDPRPLAHGGGGVLAFYVLKAQLTMAPPPGQTFEVGIPGFYSSSQAPTSATISYAEQFATYIQAISRRIRRARRFSPTPPASPGKGR